MNLGIHDRSACRDALSLLSLLGLSVGCAAPAFPLSADMHLEAAHHELGAVSGELFSNSWEVSAGPYKLKVKQSTTEHEEGPAERIKTTRVVRSEVAVSRGGASIGTARCLDQFVWVQTEDTMFASDVSDEYRCEGKAGDRAFKLSVERDGQGRYEGRLTSNGSSTRVSSVHGRQAGIETLALGYTLGQGSRTHAALRIPRNGKPGDLWVREEFVGDVERLAVLSLVAFKEGE